MKALIIVDVQNDFLPGGALAVPDGDAVMPVINQLSGAFDLVVATQDWHPADHGSFAANHRGGKVGDVIQLDGLPQVLWPVHCVQETRGAAFAPGLDVSRLAKVFRKGQDRRIDSYSGFADNGGRRSTGLGEYMRERGVGHVHVVGLATDFCVKFTALDALSRGFGVSVIEDACRGVELRPGDSRRALDEVVARGGRVVNSDDAGLRR